MSVVAANAMNQARDTYPAAGLQFLSKPFSQQELFNELEKAFEIGSLPSGSVPSAVPKALDS